MTDKQIQQLIEQLEASLTSRANLCEFLQNMLEKIKQFKKCQIEPMKFETLEELQAGFEDSKELAKKHSFIDPKSPEFVAGVSYGRNSVIQYYKKKIEHIFK